ncbi:MAG: FKBP-type peptidyl-prolyl cis-trans isomerase [Candidatus Aenigmarchaeota archaeon]|nr:FKBP-type peptidyl-prolyl cis-trans isomerase [Candidatus Aenigmarchaeota archaeon]
MEKGDFVEIEYIGQIQGSQEIFDLTNEKIAKETGIFNPNVKYGPMKIIVGKKMMLPPLDKAIEKMKISEEKEITINKEDGFGNRDLKMIKIISLNNLKKQNINPIAGQFLNFGNLQGKVISVNSGRVRIDFNHPLAGKNLVYKLKLTKKIENKKDMVETICENIIKITPEIDLKTTSLTLKTKIKIPDKLKTELKAEITKYIKDIKLIKIEEQEVPQKK